MMDIDYILNGKRKKKPKASKKKKDNLGSLMVSMSQRKRQTKTNSNLRSLMTTKIGPGIETKAQRKVKSKDFFGDWDKDGVINRLDCAPKNKKKHAILFQNPKDKTDSRTRMLLTKHIQRTKTPNEISKFDYRYTQKDGDTHKFDVFPQGQTWKGKTKSLNEESEGSRWNELESKKDKVYRGMHEDEYKTAMKQGYFKSRGEHNLGQGQKEYTFGTKNIQMASSYASSFAPAINKPQPGSTGYVVGFKDNEKWEKGTDETEKSKYIPRGEMATKERIPVEDVEETYEYVPTRAKKGELWINRGWGEEHETGIDWMPETEGKWKKVENQPIQEAKEPQQNPPAQEVEDTIENDGH